MHEWPTCLNESPGSATWRGDAAALDLSGLDAVPRPRPEARRHGPPLNLRVERRSAFPLLSASKLPTVIAGPQATARQPVMGLPASEDIRSSTDKVARAATNG